MKLDYPPMPSSEGRTALEGTIGTVLLWCRENCKQLWGILDDGTVSHHQLQDTHSNCLGVSLWRHMPRMWPGYFYLQPILLNKLQQVLGKRRDGSNPSGDTGHSQRSWEHNHKCWWRTCTKPALPLPPGCYQLQKGKEKPLPQKHGWWQTGNRCPAQEIHCYSWKTVQGRQNLLFIKPLTYPKSTADFHSLSTNTNTGTCRQATVRSFSFRDKGSLTDSRREPPLKWKSLSDVPHKHTSYSDCHAAAPPLSVLHPFAWPGRFNTYLAQATGPETQPC